MIIYKNNNKILINVIRKMILLFYTYLVRKFNDNIYQNLLINDGNFNICYISFDDAARAILDKIEIYLE